MVDALTRRRLFGLIPLPFLALDASDRDPGLIRAMECDFHRADHSETITVTILVMTRACWRGHYAGVADEHGLRSFQAGPVVVALGVTPGAVQAAPRSG